MRLLRPVAAEATEPCPYLPGREKRYESFLAEGLDDRELAELLESGWRKFGPYFFRPACSNCRLCIPLRVPVDAFAPSRSQKRVLRSNRDISVVLKPLQPSRDAFELHARHGRERFGSDTAFEEFLQLFYTPSVPALQSEFRLADQLVGIGWLDVAENGLSSVYFSFAPEHAARRLGTLSILCEIALTRERNLPWYYLGYYVPGCAAMAYKDRFRPRQYYDWQQQRWFDAP